MIRKLKKLSQLKNLNSVKKIEELKKIIKKRTTTRIKITSLNENNYGFFDKFRKIPYSMHYWYFNLIDLNELKTYSVILASTNTTVKINEEEIKLSSDEYLIVSANFSKNEFITKKEKILLTKNMIKTKDFYFSIKNKTLKTKMLNKNFESKKILTDSYYSDLFKLYKVININSKDENYHFQAQNVIKRGPLVPWIWLHFYLQDGTYLKAFEIISEKSRFRINNDYYDLTIKETDKKISFFAKKEDKYFNIHFKKNKALTLNYNPFISTNWKYSQYSPQIIKIETNIKNINPNQKGTGIMEITKGYSL